MVTRKKKIVITVYVVLKRKVLNGFVQKNTPTKKIVYHLKNWIRALKIISCSSRTPRPCASNKIQAQLR